MQKSLKAYGENELSNQLKKNGGMLGKTDSRNLGIQQTSAILALKHGDRKIQVTKQKQCEKMGVGWAGDR